MNNSIDQLNNLTAFNTDKFLFPLGLLRLPPPPPPPPPNTLCNPQLQSTCHYTVKHYVQICHVRVRLEVANNMHPLSGGGGGGGWQNGKDPKNSMRVFSVELVFIGIFERARSLLKVFIFRWHISVAILIFTRGLKLCTGI